MPRLNSSSSLLFSEATGKIMPTTELYPMLIPHSTTYAAHGTNYVKQFEAQFIKNDVDELA